MGLLDFLRPRPEPTPDRTWTHANDVGIFAGLEAGRQLERDLAREGIQTRVFAGLEGRAIETLVRFLPAVLVLRADQVDATEIMAALASAGPGLGRVPVVLASASHALEALEAMLAGRTGAVVTSVDPAELAAAALSLAPQLNPENP